jgi:carbon starvation protein
MTLQRGQSPLLAFVTLIPLVWLLSVTISASVIKVWDSNPKIGFLAGAKVAAEKADALKLSDKTGQDVVVVSKNLKTLSTQYVNATVDAWVTIIFLVLVSLIVVLSIYEWLRLLTRKKASILSETEPVYLPAGTVSESNPLPAFSIAMLGFTLLKELSGEAAIDRAEVCACAQAEAAGQQPQPAKYRRQNAFLTATEDRYRGVNRCC